jgi:hypothetical protein
LTLYVTGENDIFWHWCKNCPKYPSEEGIDQTTTERPTENLCPQCYDKESNDDCEGKRDTSMPVGIISI